MRLDELFREGMDDALHRDALSKTGFWGAQGAGCLFFARSTRRFLVAHRSRAVEQPGTWGTWGGAVDRGEDPVAAVKREAHEEAGYTGHVEVEPLYVFRKNDFRYYNFLLIVDDEFEPRLDWENQGFRWVELGEWPTPLHFGMTALLADPASTQKLKSRADQRSGDLLQHHP